MEKISESLENVTGGVITINTNSAHWQPTNAAMGSTYVQNGFLWYRVQGGDNLGKIAATFNTTPAQLKMNNPTTIQDMNELNAGDAIIIRRA